ncbi:MAG: 60S ribosomal export protein NMD3 [Candidatus Marsarchaeota archaeon]|jgi:nonsense-mediated mRNA decay protein 3|nr:60S ribosomal export protein NMD3 [Candidatus Marsarchaeota archaeon]
MLRHCPTCGRSSKDVRFIADFCESCVAGRLSGSVPGYADLLSCRGCGRLKTRSGFAKPDASSIADVIAAQMRGKFSVRVLRVDRDTAIVEFSTAVDDCPVSFTRSVELRRAHETCTDCFRRSSGYYEAVVQLRGDPDSVRRTLAGLTRYVEKNDAFVSKVETLPYGVDAYTSDKLVTAAYLSSRGIKAGRSYTLYGMRHGKRLYRNIYSVRL